MFSAETRSNRAAKVVPAGGDAGAGVGEDAGHGPVLLADAEHGPPRGEVLEQLARQDGPVFRVVAERKDEDRGGELLADRRQVVAVAEVHDVVAEPRFLDGSVHFAVHLAHEPETERLFEIRIGPGLDAQRLPEVQRIAVGGEQARMDDVEKAVRLDGLVEIAAVIAVRDHRHGRFRLRLEFFLHERRDGQHGGAFVQHGLLHRPEPTPGTAGHRQVLEVVHSGPRVAEIGNPGNPELLVQPLANQMHRVGRSGRHDHIDRMLRQILLQETHARPHPAYAGIRHEQVAADPQRQALLEGLFSGRNLSDLPLGRPGRERLHVRRCTLAHQLAVDVVRLGDGTADNFRLVRDFRLQGMVDGRIFRIFRRIDDRLPSFQGQILRKLHPTLDPRSAGRRPVVSDDEDAFHKTTKLTKIIVSLYVPKKQTVWRRWRKTPP